MTKQARSIVLATLAAAAGTFALIAQTAPPPAQAQPPAATPTPAPAPAPAPALAPAPAAVPAPPPPPAAVPPTPVSMFGGPRRLVDPPVVSISKLPTDNPFGLLVEEPAAAPPKPAFPELVLPAGMYAAVRVDPTGHVVSSRIIRDPVPVLAAESRKSFEQRWTFDPATKAGAPVETWASVRLDLQIEVRPREEQVVLTPITPATPLPPPFDWGDDTKWFESYKVTPPTDGTVPLEDVEKPPTPKKMKWSADSYKGPFSCKAWIRVSPDGLVHKMIPIQASDPILVPYLRKTVATWTMRPARVKGQSVESWSELSITGNISYSIDLKQVNNLRKTLATP
ncbi:MAG TPA: hypothetical protein VGQ32_06915 [Thermoanaerobaculia bacterium]|nr:hypothetical protein [Thermoanaerobaculia bacterium]